MEKVKELFSTTNNSENLQEVSTSEYTKIRNENMEKNTDEKISPIRMSPIRYSKKPEEGGMTEDATGKVSPIIFDEEVALNKMICNSSIATNPYEENSLKIAEQIPESEESNNINIENMDSGQIINNNVGTNFIRNNYKKSPISFNKYNKVEDLIVNSDEVEEIKNMINSTNNNRLYFVENGELYFKMDKSRFIPICNFIVIVEKKIIIDNGESRNEKYLLRGFIENKIELPRIYITAGEFQDSKWIHEKWGIQCKIYPGRDNYRHIQAFISGEAQNIREQTIFNHVGWRKVNGFNLYLHGKGAIGLSSNNLNGKKEYALEFNQNLSEVESINKLIDMLNIAEDHVSIPLLTYTVLGLLNKLFEEAGFEPKFILFLNGVTGSRKTTLAKMFTNIFNRNKDFVPASFKDTAASLEVKTFEYKDSVLIVDDYHPTTSISEKRNMDSIASYLTRIYGDKISKSRMNKNMQKQREFKPRGLCLITGEDTIGGSSTTARYISLEIKESDVNLYKLTEYQQDMTVYSTALSYFLYYVSLYYEDIVKYIRNQYLFLREKSQNKYSHGRLLESHISMEIAFSILLSYIENWGFDRNQIELLRSRASKVFNNIVTEHNESMAIQNPGIMYLKAIKDLVETGKIKLLNRDEKRVNQYIVGYKDSSYMYLIPETAYIEVKGFWSRLNKEFPLSIKETNKALENLGIIKVQQEGDKKVRTIKVSIGDTRSRYLVVNIDIMNNILSNME